MKKFVVFMCFTLGIGALAAAILMQKIEPTIVDPEMTVSKQPKLLSEIDVTDYVSLPVLESVSIHETYEIPEKDAEKAALDRLLVTAKKLNVIEGECTAFLDMTISSKDEFINSEVNKPFYVSRNSNKALTEALSGKATGDFVKVNDVEYQPYGTVDIQMTVRDIYAMPYPVTDDYVKKNTNYSSFDEMKNEMTASNTFTAISETRSETVDNLIDQMIAKTTFITIPDSLCKEEYEVLQKEDPSSTYEDARESLKKIFFIATVVKEKGLATNEEIDKRASDIMSNEGLTQYEKERARYLLYEEDVTNYVYKNIKIEQKETDDSQL